ELDVLPDPLLYLLGPPALHGVVDDEGLQGRPLLGQYLARVRVRLEEAAVLRQRQAADSGLHVDNELLEPKRGRGDVARTGLACRRLALRGDRDDQRRERSDDDEREHDAREPHPAGKRHRSSSSSTAPLSSSGSNGFETNRSAPATRASSSAWLQAVITTTSMSFSFSSLRISSSTSIPLRPGSITSSTIR